MSKIPLISQSMIKAYDSTGAEHKDSYRQCEVHFTKYYLLGEKELEPEIYDPTVAFHKGLWFENRLIGATRDGAPVNFKQTKATKNHPSKPYTAELQLQEVVDYAKGVMDLYDMTWDQDDVQPAWEHEEEGVSGHIDLFPYFNGKRAIVDIKYTDMAINQTYGDQQWARPEFRDHIQAVHYTYLGQLIYGKNIPFYYMVFGKAKWTKFVQAVVTDKAIDEHVLRIQSLKNKLIDWNPVPCGMYNLCKECPFLKTCNVATTVPQIEKIHVGAKN